MKFWYKDREGFVYRVRELFGILLYIILCISRRGTRCAANFSLIKFNWDSMEMRVLMSKICVFFCNEKITCNKIPGTLATNVITQCQGFQLKGTVSKGYRVDEMTWIFITKILKKIV